MWKFSKALEVETSTQTNKVEFFKNVAYILFIYKMHHFLTNCLSLYVSAYCEIANVAIYALGTIFTVFFIICQLLLGQTKNSVPGNFETNLWRCC